MNNTDAYLVRKISTKEKCKYILRKGESKIDQKDV